MLNALSCFGNGLLCKRSSVASCVFGPQAFSAYISTNTAINKSLRKSQRSGRELKRRPSSRQGTISKYDGLNNPFSRNDTQIFDGPNVHGRTERPKGHHRIDIGIRVRGYEAANPSRGSNARGNPFEKIRRPNHQEGMDVEDMESPSIKKSQGMQRLHRSTLRRNENGEFDRSTRGAQYDYKEHPEGNRASRRVIKFGRPVERLKPSESHSTTRQSNHRQTSYGNNYRSSGNDRSSRTSEQRHASQKYNRLTIPEALQDDLEASSNTARSHFTMGRQTDRIDSAKNVSQTWDSDHEPLARANSNFKGYGRASFQRDDSEPPFRQSNVPLSIPYTTSASEFLYGTSVVSAALLSSRRKLYKLYIYSGDNREVGDQDTYIRNLALSRGVVVERVKGDWLRLMDKMSTGRPHNGYILEASPLPKLPVVGFQPVSKRCGEFHVILDHQSREDEAVNGRSTILSYEVSFPRYPFVLLLDGILDPGNLGAILRTAFFLGVDTVAVANRNSAPVSPVAIKASAGASESLPIVSVGQPQHFLDVCKSNGWKVYAAVAPKSDKRSGFGNYLVTSKMSSPARDHPCILILGGEGEGLRWTIQKMADFDIAIDGQRAGKGNVDSLNVSVAAGLLCEAFLRERAGASLEVEMGTYGSSENADLGNRIF